MKHILVLSIAVFALFFSFAFAEGSALRTYTPFADMDPAAQGWEELLQAWEGETGNKAEDYSGVQDETWIQQVKDAATSDAADLLILSPGMMDAGSVVPVDELRALGAEDARNLPCMREEDGTVLLAPVRLGYETLFVNTDVLESAGLPAPQTWEDILISCAVLSQMGVTPIANSLTEWAEIVLDCCAVIAVPLEEFGNEASLSGAREVLSDLVAVGAFGADPWNAEDTTAAEDFLSGRAAMRFDSRDLLFSIPEERRDSAVAIILPGRDGVPRTQLPGTVSCGLAVTKSCAADAGRLSAVISLVSRILSREGLIRLSGTDGTLAESDASILLSVDGVCGTLYDRNPEGFDDWADAAVASLMTGTEE